EHRRVLDDRQHLVAHLHHDRVRVAVGHQAREAAPAGHPVAAGVVDDDQVGPAGLGALGGQAGARAGADDHAAGVERRPQLRAGLVAGHRSSSSSLSAIASANSGSLMLWSDSITSTLSSRYSRSAANSAASASTSSNGWPGASIIETPPSGRKSAV